MVRGRTRGPDCVVMFSFGEGMGIGRDEKDHILLVTFSHVGKLAKALSIVTGQRLITALPP